ncbi:hypothetical protein JL722_3442 [Aureococcus anophagefferens]|nr:hypothetical protein JL722_3442 [Aureococcus anophagefferens]
MGAGGSTPIAAPFATFATWTAGSCAALVEEYKDKDYDFGIDLPTVEALTGLDKALAEGIVASLTRRPSPRADRASLVYDIFDFDTRREISKDEMTILLLCTVRAAKVVAGAGEDPSDDIMEATTAAAFEKHAARLDVIKKDEFFGSLKGELPAAPSGERYNTLLPSPAGAKYALAVVQFKVPGHPNGGSDKGPDGNRIDSIPIANGVIKAGGACDMLLYDYTDHAGFEATIEKYDALIVRINPGQLSQIPGVDGVQAKFDATMNAFVGKGKPVWSSPGVQQKMGAKDALCKIANMGCGLVDTFAYYDAETLETQFKKTMAFQPRVVKQNRGSAGEGIWLCWIANETKDGIIPDIEYPSKTFGAESLGDDVMLKLMEMNDNHVEYHTVKEFLVFCVDGPSGAGAGTWTSTFPGEYLKGGAAAGGQLVDQRLLPRISEGEVRVLMAGDTCQMIIHKKPEGGLSAVGGNSAYTYYEPSDPLYADLLTKLTTDIKNGLMDVLDLKGEALPLLWTCDYIPKNPEGWSKTENACDMETEYVVGEFNCSCVGVSMFQAVCGGDKTLADVRYNTLLPSPAGAKYSLAVVQFKVPGHPNGGSDKGPDGNRIDSIPIANGVIKAGGACDMLLYDYTDHAGFEATIEKYDALIVRINPGQLSQIPGVDGVQAKFDATMNAFVGKGKPVWSSPGVQQKMGAKDALCKIANMGCGLVDTFAYYDAETLETQFKKTMAFQPRVVKQNRGSAGEGIWLCWIANETKDGIIPDIEYPSKTFGAESLGDDVMLKLMEMNDNHVEYHTVKEFLVFCVDGPSGAGAGTWTSTFPGEYLKGGAAAASSSTSGSCPASPRARSASSWRATRAR